MTDTTALAPQTRFPNWQDIVVYSPDGPQPQFLMGAEQFKVLMAGLEAGQQIPPHPEGLAMYHFLAGTGSMTVNGETLPVQTGDTVITPAGASRGIVAETKLAFLAAKPG
ncbi:MAG: cupin domain-containing protein [Caldilineaceae bacterium]|nr:cupin domain-containing protein [Caldilineaceae bacterium]MBP8109539.1 cupin domain-containing protein [Caldilineaceae bacterium]MBP8121901.1 cupin domain-containing protein [Caldilineaceae bacterium]MBP9073134.1 cupin domain-containing protein [Caldilineaceae bacterium]